MIPKELIDIVNFLAKERLELPIHGTDSRANSTAAEDHIVKILLNGASEHGHAIHSPNVGKRTNRAWYDVKIADTYFCDIKVTGLAGNDNTNAKKAIYYLLTGQDPENVLDRENIFFKELQANESPDEARDYFYIVVNKTDTSDIFIVSLKGIAKIAAASNNPPFQCKWDGCRFPVQRSWQEAKSFLLGAWAESIKRKIKNVQKGMPTFYPEFF